MFSGKTFASIVQIFAASAAAIRACSWNRPILLGRLRVDVDGLLHHPGTDLTGRDRCGRDPAQHRAVLIHRRLSPILRRVPVNVFQSGGRDSKVAWSVAMPAA